ncbi:MAG: DUF3369 domain-containing protein [Rhodospirillales bacterium]|jgi:response regulator RpfG family c-di-GMP phosphodiesterase|nr:DUF3369 domain-containing protein [Rhodospirillales bacterium]MBT5351111.1 DUF3369 domain-containing protein [Rhodospirillales bacterium]MBT5521611.1 DUF3369 domain-containing protein [Rhodospirillales bacterium]MBT6109565.1 DUF3369 domain-containing protein [Rhodospirillales bacterium]MBT7145687.1 DUF3369 domain-containing protein [Rhodospirillales bacterium]
MNTLVKHDEDELMFGAEEVDAELDMGSAKWKIMLVDDEPDIHEVSKMALNDFSFDDRGVEFICALSGAEAKQSILDHPDTAVMLLDVVMETEHAGLDVAKFVREEANNKNVRIILRTGQPGQAPEKKVITEYDINDYKEKTELTASKLFTLMYASLRSYRDIMALEANKVGLERVIEASSNIFELRNMQNFTQGVLEQITSLLYLDKNAAYFNKADGLAASHAGEGFEFMAGIGSYENISNENATKLLTKETLTDLEQAIEDGCNHYIDDRFIGFFKSSRGSENLVHLSGLGTMSDLDRSLMEVFAKNIGVAFDNIELHQDLEETQREIVYMLGEAVETRSKETGNHVKRVAEISKLLALDYGLSNEEAEIMRLASPMHDVGKIGIPDAILNKPGRHTPEEFEIMKTHAMLGYDMLKNSKRRILQAGAMIARGHHEKWNGAGYPDGIKGDDIHIYGRITAVADVFDALGSDRCYKKAWPMEQILDLFNEESGQQFDPQLVDGLMNNLDSVIAIRDAFAD